MLIAIGKNCLLFSSLISGFNLIRFAKAISLRYRIHKSEAVGKAQIQPYSIISLLFGLNLIIVFLYNISGYIINYKTGNFIFRGSGSSKFEGFFQLLEIYFTIVEKCLFLCYIFNIKPLLEILVSKSNFCSIYGRHYLYNSKAHEYILATYIFTRVLSYIIFFFFLRGYALLMFLMLEVLGVTEIFILLMVFIYIQSGVIIFQKRYANNRKYTHVFFCILTEKINSMNRYNLIQIGIELVYRVIMISLLLKNTIYKNNIASDLSFTLFSVGVVLKSTIILKFVDIFDFVNEIEALSSKEEINSEYIFYNPYDRSNKEEEKIEEFT